MRFDAVWGKTYAIQYANDIGLSRTTSEYCEPLEKLAQGN